MELKDISGNIVYGGKDDTINLLEELANAILKGGITIDEIRVTDLANEIRKEGINMEDIKYKYNGWKKISFWYELGKKE